MSHGHQGKGAENGVNGVMNGVEVNGKGDEPKVQDIENIVPDGVAEKKKLDRVLDKTRCVEQCGPWFTSLFHKHEGDLLDVVEFGITDGVLCNMSGQNELQGEFQTVTCVCHKTSRHQCC